MIAIDPRSPNAETIPLLAALGYNCLSVGVPDLRPAVQAAVNRVQPGA